MSDAEHLRIYDDGEPVYIHALGKFTCHRCGEPCLVLGRAKWNGGNVGKVEIGLHDPPTCNDCRRADSAEDDRTRDVQRKLREKSR